MKKFNILVCSTNKILHDLSSDRRKPDRFLSIIKLKKICTKGLFFEIIFFLMNEFNKLN